MMSLVVVIGLVAACSASPSLYFSGPQYYSTGYHYPAAVIGPVKSQYHAQNELGQYTYGYNDGYSSKAETKHANGLTEGSYSYVDPNGELQQYRYVSDENGFRVSGTNLPVAPAAVPAVPAVSVPVVADAPTVVEAVAVTPAAVEPVEMPQQVQDTPEVAAAKVAHQAAFDEAKKAAEAAPADDESSSDDTVEVPAAPVVEAVQVSKTVVAPAPAPAAAVFPAASYAYQPAAYATAYPSYAYAAGPVAAYTYAHPSYAYAPAPYAAPAQYAASYTAGSYSPVHSQYHAQDEFGQYSYGYNSGSSSKAEVKTLDGVTRGGYSYVDANGLVQQYNYVSDPINGFRVAGTNLPVANH